MLDVNMIIANNIQAELKKENKKQVDLAEGIGVSRQTMSKIMNGARAINAIELHKISEYLHVSMDSLMKMPEKPMDTNVIHAFMGRVKTEEARKGIRLADELSDMILFHTRVCENGKKMAIPLSRTISLLSYRTMPGRKKSRWNCFVTRSMMMNYGH